MRRSFLSIFFIYVAINGVLATPPRLCDEKELKRCKARAEILLRNADVVGAETASELTYVCRLIKDAFGCLHNFVDRCIQPKYRELYKTSTSGIEGVFSELCTEGNSFRNDYLEHAPCLKTIKEQYQECFMNFAREKQAMVMAAGSASDKIKRTCCLFDLTVKCTRTAVLSKCSEGAADVGQRIIMKSTGPIMDAYCNSYKFSEKECTPTFSAAYPVVTGKFKGFPHD